ncbi:MAG TPA: alpha/beta hydrolase [Novosphingobium sp.]
MLRLARLFLPLLACVAAPLAAQTGLAAEPAAAVEVSVASEEATAGSGRFVASRPAALPRGIAAYGPFRVLDDGHAALVDVTDENSPAAFQAMLTAYPGIHVLELVECPGTEEDRANLRLGRMIRTRGIDTHVPQGGSVRSGAVELFLAGVHHRAEPGAEFAVHAWADEDGHEPKDYPRDAPENRAYLDYYQQMGMTPAEARAFYDMTNAVPNASARWMDSAQMGHWVRYN